jgi:hypothetical protein
MCFFTPLKLVCGSLKTPDRAVSSRCKFGFPKAKYDFPVPADRSAAFTGPSENHPPSGHQKNIGLGLQKYFNKIDVLILFENQ